MRKGKLRRGITVLVAFTVALACTAKQRRPLHHWYGRGYLSVAAGMSTGFIIEGKPDGRALELGVGISAGVWLAVEIVHAIVAGGHHERRPAPDDNDASSGGGIGWGAGVGTRPSTGNACQDCLNACDDEGLRCNDSCGDSGDDYEDISYQSGDCLVACGDEELHCRNSCDGLYTGTVAVCQPEGYVGDATVTTSGSGCTDQDMTIGSPGDVDALEPALAGSIRTESVSAFDGHSYAAACAYTKLQAYLALSSDCPYLEQYRIYAPACSCHYSCADGWTCTETAQAVCAPSSEHRGTFAAIVRTGVDLSTVQAAAIAAARDECEGVPVARAGVMGCLSDAGQIACFADAVCASN
jgi:hypothetical protein